MYEYAGWLQVKWQFACNKTERDWQCDEAVIDEEKKKGFQMLE
jgi:hypothetical protein